MGVRLFGGNSGSGTGGGNGRQVSSLLRRRPAGRRLVDYPRRERSGIRRWLPSWRLLLGTVVCAAAAVAGGLAIAVSVVDVPRPNDFATRQATTFSYADGSTQIAHLGVNRRSVPLKEVPEVVRHAVLAAEDRSFYQEGGISPTGILRALMNDVTGGGGLQGGSTITQQYVKNYYLTQEQSLNRKLKEVLVSLKIDNNLSKDTIFQNYLNTIYLARDAYGIETAARAYFGVPVSALADDPAKAAYLAALIQSPYYYATADSDPAAARALHHRWDYVLDGMVREHWISTAQRAALTFPEPVTYHANGLGGMNGYMVNAAVQSLDRLHRTNDEVPDSAMLARGGYTVVTTFRKDAMEAARKSVQDDAATLKPKTNKADRNLHLGLTAVDNRSGAVLGFYGGPDYLRQGFNDALQAAGPLGPTVGTSVAKAAVAADSTPPHRTGTSRQLTAADYWSDMAESLKEKGIDNAHPEHRGLHGDDLLTTPLHAAGAMAALNRGTYRAPYEVAEVRKGSQVIWRASGAHSPAAPGYSAAPGKAAVAPGRQKWAVRGGKGLLAEGTDGSYQWAWSVGYDARMSVAVAMYATKDDGTTHRDLSGITPGTGKGRTDSVAVDRASEVLLRFLDVRFDR